MIRPPELMHASRWRHVGTLFLLLTVAGCASAAGRARSFAGAVAGISTLSADGRSIITPASADVSLYKPENGLTLNLLAGVHLNDYLSLQGNYIWNRNTLTLSASHGGDQAATFFEERRCSSQHAVIGDALLYFRRRDSWVRPYLSGGTGLVWFSADESSTLAVRGGPPRPPLMFTATEPALRVAVGVDLGGAGNWRFRYSFSETISGNPVSERLVPPGERGLANFQNLFGVTTEF